MNVFADTPADRGGPDLGALSERLQYTFHEPDLLRRAMAHRSWCSESNRPSNERLEFLGDAVLGMAVADHVYGSFVELTEGELTDARKSVVNATTLAAAGAELGLGEALLLGRGEDAAGGREKTSILADALEAVIGAVYLDGGWEAARTLVVRLLGDRVAAAVAGLGGLDHKTLLQEVAARRFANPPLYEVADEGPDHAKRFFAAVFLDGQVQGRGEGRSKKQAEQAAAGEAWEHLRAEAKAKITLARDLAGVRTPSAAGTAPAPPKGRHA